MSREKDVPPEAEVKSSKVKIIHFSSSFFFVILLLRVSLIVFPNIAAISAIFRKKDRATSPPETEPTFSVCSSTTPTLR